MCAGKIKNMTKIRPLATAAAAYCCVLLTTTTVPVVVAQSSTEETCGFCPGGYPPLNPSALVDATNDNSTTCGDVHNLLLTGVSAGEDCAAARVDAILGGAAVSFLAGGGSGGSGYPAACGYCAPPRAGSTTSCSLCPAGDVPSLPADTPVTLPDGTESTCGEAAYRANLERIYSDGCLALQQSSIPALCGCEPTVCAVCPDGNTELADPDMWSFAAEMSCGDLARNAAALDPTGEDCRTVQTIAMGECGCGYVPPYQPGCALCADGVPVPDPSYQLFPGDELSTCGLYGWYAALPPFGTGNEQCTALQATFGAACGCPSPPRPPCRVRCQGYLDDETGLYQDVVFNATHVVSDFEVGDADFLFEDYHLCGEILFEMSINDDICTPDGIAALQDECCMVPYVPPKSGSGRRQSTGVVSAAAIMMAYFMV